MLVILKILVGGRKMNFDFLTDEEILKNAKPKDFRERELLKIALENLGEFTTIKKLGEFFNLSQSYIYKSMEERKLISYKSGSKTLIMTKSILNIIHSRDE